MTEYFWHFSAANEEGKPRLGYDDGRLIEAGITHKVKCKPILCESGLHASRKSIDALNYAPGPLVSLCTLGGEVVHGDDRSVATERTYLWVANAEGVMREFARWCALQVCHLWECPPLVKQYLETGDESLRGAARAAAWAAWDAARAAGNAARAAAWAAAWDVWDAARNAARAAAWAAWDAARAAGNAARDAAWAAWDAAWAAGNAARDAQEKRFTEMLMSLAPKGWKP